MKYKFVMPWFPIAEIIEDQYGGDWKAVDWQHREWDIDGYTHKQLDVIDIIAFNDHFIDRWKTNVLFITEYNGEEPGEEWVVVVGVDLNRPAVEFNIYTLQQYIDEHEPEEFYADMENVVRM